MTFCKKCGKELVEGAKFCPKCGQSVDSPVVHSARESYGRYRRKPMSTMTIALIVVVAVVIIGGLLLSAVFIFGGWHLGEVVGSGDLATNQEFISDFTAVDAESGFNVKISQSDSYSVMVTADDNIMEYIEVKKSGDTLKIGVKWGYSLRTATLDVAITMPELFSIDLSGGAKATIEEFNVTSDFSIEVSGGSRLAGEFETSGDVDIDASGGSPLSLNGKASDLTIDASSGSNLGLSHFEVHNADVELSGGSLATINLDGRLDADLSGGSLLSYIGDATLGNIETTGGSQISKQTAPD